ncbi:MAG: flippase, partial [Nitrososphaera sp.]|nr:flippase [Nitrososphaera sp.]
YLGPDDFGIYNYAHALVGLFAVLAGLGLDGIVVREIVRGSAARYEVLGTAFALKLISGVLALVLAVLVVSLLRPDDALTRWLVGILAAGMMFQCFSVIDLWFQSQVRAKYSVCARTLAFLVVVATFVTLILKKAPLIAFALTSLAETVLAAAAFVVLYTVTGHRIRAWRFNGVWGKTLIKDGWPLILSGLTIMVYMKIDQIMIGEMIGGRAVGLYSAATRISEVWYFVPVAVVSSVFPTLLRS